MAMYKTAIIIVNWNSTEETLNCINALNKDYNIIVVDNGSTEPPTDLPANVHLIINDKNYGFAYANNQGIRYAIERFTPDYILLLNSDTIPTKDFLIPLINLMEKDKKIGAVQPKLLKLIQGSTSNIIDSAGQVAYPWGSVRDRGIGKPDGMEYQERKQIFGACAACVLYRVSALKETGLFDENLFCLFEDVDLSYRLKQKGYKIYYEPTSIVYHKRGISGKITKENKIIRRFYGFRNCLIVSIRYLPIWLILVFLPVHLYRLIIAMYFKIRYKIEAPFWRLILKG